MEPAVMLLARHGRTALNAAGRLRGLADPPLDDVGLAEARTLAGALAERGVGLVRSSPLQRAAATAAEIGLASGVAAEADARFNDRDYGPWTGEVKAEVAARFGTVDAAPGVEPMQVVLARALPALDDLADRAGGRPVVVVTHDAVLRPLLRAIDPGLDALEQPTGCWNEVHRDEAGHWHVDAVDLLP